MVNNTLHKIIKVGSSGAVTLPKQDMEAMELGIGDTMELRRNIKTKTFTFRVRGAQKQESVAREKHIAKLTMNFIERYRSDLDALAKQ